MKQNTILESFFFNASFPVMCIYLNVMHIVFMHSLPQWIHIPSEGSVLVNCAVYCWQYFVIAKYAAHELNA